MESIFKEGSRGLLERISSVLADPKETFEQIIMAGPALAEPLFITLLTAASLGAVVGSFIAKIFLLVSALSEGFGGLGGPGLPRIAVMAFAMPPLAVTGFIAAALTAWIVTACLAHLFAVYIFGGRGSPWRVFKLYGYSATPHFLTVTGLLMVAFNLRLAVYFIPLALASAFWSVMINIAAIQVTYGLSSGRAFISAFIPPTIIALILSSIWGVIL